MAKKTRIDILYQLFKTFTNNQLFHLSVLSGSPNARHLPKYQKYKMCFHLGAESNMYLWNERQLRYLTNLHRIMYSERNGDYYGIHSVHFVVKVL